MVVGVKEERWWIGRTKDFQHTETVLCETTMLDTCNYTFVKVHIMYTKNESWFGFWVLRMQSMDIHSVTNVLVLVVKRGKAVHVWDTKCSRALFSAKFCWEQKSTLNLFLKNLFKVLHVMKRALNNTLSFYKCNIFKE